MRLAEIQGAITSLCFSAEEPSVALLDELGEPAKWRMYRELVRNRLRKGLRHALRGTCKVLPAAAFEAAFVTHLDRDPPRTRFFREVVRAFAQTAIPAWRGDASLPAWVADLATYELAQWEVSDLEAERRPSLQEFAFDRVAVLSDALALLSLDHAVHRAPRKDGSYERVPTRLAVFRPSDDAKVKTWMLEPLLFTLLSIVREGELDTASALRLSAERASQALDAACVDRVCGALAELIEAGLILGCR